MAKKKKQSEWESLREAIDELDDTFCEADENEEAAKDLKEAIGRFKKKVSRYAGYALFKLEFCGPSCVLARNEDEIWGMLEKLPEGFSDNACVSNILVKSDIPRAVCYPIVLDPKLDKVEKTCRKILEQL